MFRSVKINFSGVSNQPAVFLLVRDNSVYHGSDVVSAVCAGVSKGLVEARTKGYTIPEP